MSEMEMKCSNCGSEGKESYFENEQGIKNCPWCDSDNWLIENEI